MISFELEQYSIEVKLTFAMVIINQFFIDDDGWLCQKSDSDKYVTLADDCALPSCVQITNVDGERSINKILPVVYKIRF